MKTGGWWTARCRLARATFADSCCWTGNGISSVFPGLDGGRTTYLTPSRRFKTAEATDQLEGFLATARSFEASLRTRQLYPGDGLRIASPIGSRP